jgi:hypothetical protein
VIGGGLGGLTAAGLVTQAGRKTLLIERIMKSAARHPLIASATWSSKGRCTRPAIRTTPLPKYHVLTRLGVLDAVQWVPTEAIYEVRGGPLSEPFMLPEGFAKARQALVERFTSSVTGINSVLGSIECRLRDQFRLTILLLPQFRA